MDLEILARRFANRSTPAGARYRLLRNDAGAAARIDVYDDIVAGSGWFGGVSAQDIASQLAEVEGDVEVHINSAGGDVFDGIAIYNALAQRAGNVTTVVDGIAASIASVIAQAGKTRVIAPGAMMMIHDALCMTIGNAGDHREVADLLDQVSDNLASVYASRGGTAADWRKAMQAETWYTAQDAVDAGLADQLAERPAAPEAVAGHDFSLFAKVPDWLNAAAESRMAENGQQSCADLGHQCCQDAQARSDDDIRAVVRDELEAHRNAMGGDADDHADTGLAWSGPDTFRASLERKASEH